MRQARAGGLKAHASVDGQVVSQRGQAGEGVHPQLLRGRWGRGWEGHRPKGERFTDCEGVHPQLLWGRWEGSEREGFNRSWMHGINTGQMRIPTDQPGQRGQVRSSTARQPTQPPCPAPPTCASPARWMLCPGRSLTPSKYCTGAGRRPGETGDAGQPVTAPVLEQRVPRCLNHKPPCQHCPIGAPTLPSALAARISAASVA